jgi:hypothetical protein
MHGYFNEGVKLFPKYYESVSLTAAGHLDREEINPSYENLIQNVSFCIYLLVLVYITWREAERSQQHCQLFLLKVISPTGCVFSKLIAHDYCRYF